MNNYSIRVCDLGIGVPNIRRFDPFMEVRRNDGTLFYRGEPNNDVYFTTSGLKKTEVSKENKQFVDELRCHLNSVMEIKQALVDENIDVISSTCNVEFELDGDLEYESPLTVVCYAKELLTRLKNKAINTQKLADVLIDNNELGWLIGCHAPNSFNNIVKTVLDCGDTDNAIRMIRYGAASLTIGPSCMQPGYPVELGNLMSYLQEKLTPDQWGEIFNPSDSKDHSLLWSMVNAYNSEFAHMIQNLLIKSGLNDDAINKILHYEYPCDDGFYFKAENTQPDTLYQALKNYKLC